LFRNEVFHGRTRMERTRRQAATTLLAAAATALIPPRVLASAGLADAEADVAEPPATPGPDGSVAAGRDPFEHLTAPVSLNGQGPSRSAAAPGAGSSWPPRRRAEQLALPIQEKRQVHTIVGMKTAPMALVDELKVGVRSRRRVAALAIPIDEPEIEGVLAVD